MKSKPVVMDHFSTIHSAFIIDFSFTNNITILMGDSEPERPLLFYLLRNAWL